MHYFIELLLYCFKTLTSKELADIIQYIAGENKIEINDFNVIFNAALKLLFKDEKIVKVSTQKYSSYQLSRKVMELGCMLFKKAIDFYTFFMIK